MAQSIFQEIATSQQYQLFVDGLSDQFKTPWYRRFFPIAPPQISLTYTSIIGESDMVSAASVVSQDGETPLRSRAALRKLQGEIPAIRSMRPLDSSQVRDFMALQAMNVSDAVKKQQVMSLIWNDTKYVAEAVDQRLDFIIAEGLSTGEITLTINNNPDGIVSDDPLSLKLPASNKKHVSTIWTSVNTADPIKDIQAVVDAAEDEGVTFGRILMDGSLIQTMLATKAIKDLLTKFSTGSPTSVGTLNDYLTASDLPIVEKVNFRIPIEKNGVKSIINPWTSNNAVFIPDGNLGVIKNAIAIEEQRPVSGVVYAKQGNKLISKWSKNEPFQEWTKGEFNAFPSFDSIRSIFLLVSNSTS